MHKYLITASLILGSSIFCSCQSSQEQKEEKDTVKFDSKEGDFADYKRTGIEEDEINFDNSFYQFGNFSNSFFINEKRIHRILHFDLEGDFLREINSSTILEAPFEPSSLYVDKDTTYIFYFHQLMIAKSFDDSVKIINLSERFSEGLTTDINRFEVLDNGHILIPYALNIYNNYEESKDLVGNTSEGLHKADNLFALYNSEGVLLTKFGEFPESNEVENPRLARNAYFYYAIQKDKIYVTFPLGNEICIYDTQGELLRKFNFDLPLFEKEAKPNYFGNDAILGIAVDKYIENEILYLHAVTHVNPLKIRHILYEMNLTKNSITYDEILNGNNYLLPYANENKVFFLKGYVEKEEKDLITYYLD